MRIEHCIRAGFNEIYLPGLFLIVILRRGKIEWICRIIEDDPFQEYFFHKSDVSVVWSPPAIPFFLCKRAKEKKSDKQIARGGDVEKTGVIKKNTAARRLSRLMKKMKA